MTPECPNRDDESSYRTDSNVLQCPLEMGRSLRKNCTSHKGNHELYITGGFTTTKKDVITDKITKSKKKTNKRTSQ
jgi:hypothetical protein